MRKGNGSALPEYLELKTCMHLACYMQLFLKKKFPSFRFPLFPARIMEKASFLIPANSLIPRGMNALGKAKMYVGTKK